MGGTSIRNPIRQLRHEHGEMTQRSLSQQVAVTRQTVTAIEQGRYSPSLEPTFRAAKAFGVAIDRLFQYGGEPGGGTVRQIGSWCRKSLLHECVRGCGGGIQVGG
ncbi:MAG: helix-turn-helix transcriptional regulator [Bryobacteraceae bacterium]|nr:helix-turn-helix transcriptional regulator [Bryobacteraceae bacterium]